MNDKYSEPVREAFANTVRAKRIQIVVPVMNKTLLKRLLQAQRTLRINSQRQ